MRRVISRANRTDEHQVTENDNSRIGMSELCSRVIKNEVNSLGIELVCAHQHNNSDQEKNNFNDSWKERHSITIRK